MFKHFIITWFNIKFDWRSGSKWNAVVPPIDWYNSRFEIFKKYTYTSIVNQTNQNFEWLVFFDDETSNHEEINKLDRFIPVYMKESDYVYCTHDDVISEIKKYVENDLQWIITSNLDCDDMYHPEMIEEIQKRFSNEGMLIDFIHGLFLDIKTKKLNQHGYINSISPFFSLVEPWDDNIKTCKYDNNGTGRKLLYNYFSKLISNRINNKSKPMWLSTINGKNKLMGMRGKSAINSNINEFGITI
jgi:hypothetical protein